MGTSSSYGGPSGGTPIIPSWLDVGSPLPSPAPAADQISEPIAPPVGAHPGEQTPSTNVPPLVAPTRPPIPPVGAADRFRTPRGNFSRFASSGGSDRASLGRAVSGYVSTSSGGARQAAQRMGSSRGSSGRLAGFLADVGANGAREALKALNLEGLAGQPIERIFLGLADYICPDGGSIDEGIAREAFIETITELAEQGITDLDAMSPEQMQTVFELYATNAIEARLCNDIGANALVMPANVNDAQTVQAQLRDFIRRSVSDSLARAGTALTALSQLTVSGFVTTVYEQAFGILRSIGEAEAEK
jgi:hypothetical protein